MTEPLDLDAIEKQALANVGGPADTEAMRALICAVRERDAGIAQLKTMIMKEEEMVGLLDDLRALAQKAGAPSGADAMARAEKLFPRAWADLWFSGPLNQLPRLQERVARALQQYGDERAAVAIESLREPTVAMRIAGDHFEGDTVGTWRAMFNVALAAKPGSET